MVGRSAGRAPAACAALACVLTLAFTVAFALAAGPGAAQAGERITDYAVELDVGADGTLVVHEAITYDFGTTPRHGIVRDLVRRERYDEDHDRRYEIDVLGVSASEGTPAGYETSVDGPFLRLRIGDPARTVTGPHRYDIRYRVRGALQSFAEHVELYWDAIGTQWPVPIDRASVVVRTPAPVTRSACFAGAEGSSLPCAQTTADGGSARFTQGALGPGRGLTVVVAVPAGAIEPPPAPILVERRGIEDAFAVTPATVGGAALLAAAGLGAVGTLAWRRGRDRRFAGPPTDAAFGNATGAEEPVPLGAQDAGPVEFVPPEGLRPGQVGTLVDERADLTDVTATIVDLATRGWLTITELEPEGILRRRHDYRLDRAGGGRGEPRRYEQVLLDALFADGPSVRLSELKYRFRPHLERVRRALYEDVVERGWFRTRPDRTRAVWRAAGIAVAVAGAGLVALAAATSSLGIVPLGVVATGLALVALAGRMPARTAKGSAMLARVRGFRRLFDEGEEDVRARFAERQGIFSEYLPYAIAFGCTHRWARAFEGLGAEALGTAGWYSGTAGPGGLDAPTIAAAMDDFDTVATGTLAANPPSSSGSSGFSGGSSGGGGGGGGGGSW
ncbi:MAG: hypothetical protein KatS3mg009_1162 [Acidimicrobiia bacterium]|nr:MAG: hypothetical protein KatS3mg009_1162 [Acidimicrobiia bacterium]